MHSTVLLCNHSKRTATAPAAITENRTEEHTMTNEQIIFNTAISSGLFTSAEANAIIKSGRRLPLHTYQEWRRMGYQVKAGEKAALVVNLWRYTKSAGKDADGNEVEAAEEHAYMAKAHLFTAGQVKKAEAVKPKTREEIAAYNRMLAEQRKARRVASQG